MINDNEDFYEDDNRDELKNILMQFNNLKAGYNTSFMDEEGFERIIDHFQNNDEPQLATEAVEIALTYYPFSASILIRKADLLLVARFYQEALEVLDKAALFDVSDMNLYILRTDAYLALDQHDKAVETLELALDYFKGEEKIELLFELADVYDDYEEFDKVFDCLKQILIVAPDNDEALYKICFWADFTGRNEESIVIHKEIIDKLPFSELAWFNLACAYQGLKLYEKAIDAYEYTIAIDEKFEYAYRNMGDAYIRLRKYKNAIEVLQKVIELARPEDVIYEAIGHCYDRLNNYAQARFHYRKAHHLNPEDTKLNYKIAITYINENQYAQAIKQLEVAMRIHKHVAEYNVAMGECKFQLEQYQEAVMHFSIAVKQKPKNISGWEALIVCLYKIEFFEDAVIQCDAALIATDQKPIFYYYQAACLFCLGKSKEALLVLEQGLYAAPKLLKKFMELLPSILQNSLVVDLLARFKRNRKM